MLPRLLAAAILGLMLAAVLRPAALSDDAPMMAMITLDTVDRVHVRDTEGVWRAWIEGAPDVVNGPFLAMYGEYEPPPPSTPASLPALSWWTIEGSTATLVLPAPVREGAQRDFAVTLTMSCAPDLAVTAKVGQGRILYAESHYGPPPQLAVPAGSIAVGFTVRPGDPNAPETVYAQRRAGVVTYTRQSYISRTEPWLLGRSRTIAHAPNPTEIVALIRDGETLRVKVHYRYQSGSRSYSGIATNAPLRGIEAVLDRLPCA